MVSETSVSTPGANASSATFVGLTLQEAEQRLSKCGPSDPASKRRGAHAFELMHLENPTSAASPCPVYPASLLAEILEDARKTRAAGGHPGTTGLAFEWAEGLRRSDHTGRRPSSYPVGRGRHLGRRPGRPGLSRQARTGSHAVRKCLTVALHAHCSVEIIR
jgi:hypothetical protein